MRNKIPSFSRCGGDAEPTDDDFLAFMISSTFEATVVDDNPQFELFDDIELLFEDEWFIPNNW